MQVISLNSGSNGNCIHVESEGFALLIDAGLSGIQAERRLAAHGRDIRDVAAVLVSHDHSDHTRGLGVFYRKFDLPACLTAKTLAACTALGEIGPVQHFIAGGTFQIGHIRVETVPTPHDAADGVAFILDDARHRLGVFTDLGHPFPGLVERLATCDAALVESNYDPEMLENGPYPWFLKERIRSPAGHLSNAESATVIAQAGSRLAWVCLAHLSAENNRPELALETHRRLHGSTLPRFVASRHEAVRMPEI